MSKRSIAHIEIPSANPEVSSKFYHDLFGWEYQTVTEPGPYTMFQTGNSGGGYSPLSDQVKPGNILIYISSPDIDADLKKAESLGATIVMPKDAVPGFGSLAIFIDPTGNQIALWEAAS
jgi:uncharacterized protein